MREFYVEEASALREDIRERDATIETQAEELARFRRDAGFDSTT